jgi:hypothetical protein
MVFEFSAEALSKTSFSCYCEINPFLEVLNYFSSLGKTTEMSKRQPAQVRRCCRLGAHSI